MLFQISALTEPFLTVRANMWLKFFMDTLNVFLEIALTIERVWTIRTSKWSLFFVHSLDMLIGRH